jgi:predicted MFS family arabinose efflux permease
VLLLMVGGLCGGLSQWFGLILAMRVAEGLAAGVLQPIPAIVILHAFERHEQGKAMGIFGFGVVLAPAVGPSVGGLLVEWWGWRSIFFVVVPFCVLALFLSRRYLPIAAPGRARDQSARRAHRHRRPRARRGRGAVAAERHGRAAVRQPRHGDRCCS